MKYPYHSALTKKIATTGKEEFFAFSRNKNHYVAMYHDIVKGELPSEYKRCDVLYIEAMWDAGIEEFNKRAESDTPYNEYIASINKIIASTDIPIYILGGKKMRNKLCKIPQCQYQFKLNGGDANMYIYNDLSEPCIDNVELLHTLASKYNCIGDFCCGYGLSGKIFYEHNKSFVMSDYSKECIYFIKQYYENLQETECI